ncbi:putative NTF2-like domain superfamily protein [Dioscorea sansibarensis]
MALVLPILEIVGVATKLAGARVCASERVKVLETRVGRDSNPLRRLGISPLFPTPLLRVSSPPSPLLREKQESDGGGDKGDYYVNMGHAIRTLREELPEMFYREPCFDIYRDDVVFKDPVNAFTGIGNYKLIFSALRFSGRLCFKALWVEIVSIWQPMKNIIMIRWIAHGVPRVPWERRRRLDGTSEYKLDKKGKIFEHRVDNVALNSPPKFKVQAVEEMIQSLACPSTPKPTFIKALFSTSPWMVVMPRFTWVRFYLALYLTLAWRSVGEE